MDELDYWRFTPHYTIVEAAALILGINPSEVIAIDDHEDDRDFYIKGEHHLKFHPVYTAIKRSLIDESLACANIEQLTQAIRHFHANSVAFQGSSQFKTEITLPTLNVSRMTPYLCKSEAILTSSEIKMWLTEKGLTQGFFFPNSSVNNAPDYMNKDHSCFAPKLYAAIKAWEGTALDDDNYGTPKQQIDKWLNARAAEFGLVHEASGTNYNRGDVKKSAIEEICSVANWNQDGGRSAKDVDNTNLPIIQPSRPPKQSIPPQQLPDEDDGVPF